MSRIDYYIEKVNNIPSGIRRTKAYPFREDNVILVNKNEQDYDELQRKIAICNKQGINIPLYIDYKNSIDGGWILEELAPGYEFQYLVDNEDITKIFGNMPYEHIQKYIHDVYTLLKNGIGVEPKRRNIFYDKEKGFTTIDVAVMNNVIDLDSLHGANQFFQMFAPVLLIPFSNDEYGQSVKEKTMLNVMKALETEYPHFEKYKRWIYRSNSQFAEFLQNRGYELTLDDEECTQLTNLIESLVNDIANEKVANPESLFINYHMAYIDLLASSINYCPDFDLFDAKGQQLDEYVRNAVFAQLKELFLNNPSDTNLRFLYMKIRKKELDPVDIYPVDILNSKIDEEIQNILNQRYGKK